MPRFEMGGLERVQMHVLSGFVKSGFQVELVTSRVSAQAQVLLKPEVPVSVLEGGRFNFFCGLARLIKKTKPDVVVTSANDVGCFVLLIRMLLSPNSKLIWAQHLSLSGPLQTSVGFRRLRLLFELWLMRMLIEKADAVVAVSKAVSDDMKVLLSPKLDVHVIYNPVISSDFDGLSRQLVQWPWEDRACPTIVFVGRLVKVKRLDVLLNAFAMCTQTSRAKLLIIGDGPETGSAVELARDLNLGEMCKFLGHQDNPFPWIREADLLVLSSDSEGFGLVLVEAMACGTQVVSTDCPYGPAEILGNGEYGRLVPTGDAKALAVAMWESLQCPIASKDKMKERAAEFGVDHAVQQYVNLLEIVLSE